LVIAIESHIGLTVEENLCCVV